VLDGINNTAAVNGPGDDHMRGMVRYCRYDWFDDRPCRERYGLASGGFRLHHLGIAYRCIAD